MTADDLLGTISLDELSAGVPGRDDAFGVEHEDGVVLDALHHQAETLLDLIALRRRDGARRLELAKHSGVVDRQRGAVGEGLCQLEISLGVAPVRFGHDHGEGPDDLAAHLQRDADVRAELQLVDEPEVLLIDGRGREQLPGNVGNELGFARAKDLGNAGPRVRIGWIPPFQLGDELQLRGVDVRHREPPPRATVDEIDGTPVSQHRDGQARDRGQGLLVVERGGHFIDGAQQERALVPVTDLLGDVAEKIDGIDDLAVQIAGGDGPHHRPALLHRPENLESKPHLLGDAALEHRSARQLVG